MAPRGFINRFFVLSSTRAIAFNLRGKYSEVAHRILAMILGMDHVKKDEKQHVPLNSSSGDGRKTYSPI